MRDVRPGPIRSDEILPLQRRKRIAVRFPALHEPVGSMPFEIAQVPDRHAVAFDRGVSHPSDLRRPIAGMGRRDPRPGRRRKRDRDCEARDGRAKRAEKNSADRQQRERRDPRRGRNSKAPRQHGGVKQDERAPHPRRHDRKHDRCLADRGDAAPAPPGRGLDQGFIRVIFEPSIPSPAISPSWAKMKA